MWKSPGTGSGIVLGFALGGFFDGILLHQILQWHHLLSLVPGMTDIRSQILWDGYFHAAMYGIAAIGLVGLWKAHRRGGDVAGRRLLAALGVGFGLWHVIDSIVSHWLLGIHRIKIDSPDPRMWDLIWFCVFGLAPFLIGWLLLRGGEGGNGGGGGLTRGRPGAVTALLVVTAATCASGLWAARPPANQPFTTIVFRPDMSPPRVFAALARSDARLVWSDSSMGVVIVEVAPERRWTFYAQGALLVSGAGLPAGCFDWTRA